MNTDEILQISNDISEGMLSPRVTKAQLIEVIHYFRNQCDTLNNRYQSLRGDLALAHLRLLQDYK